ATLRIRASASGRRTTPPPARRWCSGPRPARWRRRSRRSGRSGRRCSARRPRQAPVAEAESALGKGLRVLEQLARAGGAVRLSNLAADLGLQKSAVHRILQTLVEAGWATQEPDTGLYRASLKTWELGTVIVGSLPVKQAATPVLHELHRTTGETVSLTVLDGDDVLYLEKLLAPRPIGFTTRVGSRVPAPLTVGGRALLAYEPDFEAVVDRLLAERGEDLFDRKRALADIRKARKDGYVVGRGRSE